MKPLSLMDYLAQHPDKTRCGMLVSTISYERRGLTSVRTLLRKFSFNHVYLFSLGTEHMDGSLRLVWLDNAKKLQEEIESQGIGLTFVEGDPVQSFGVLNKLTNELGDDPNVINITSFPKSWIIQLAMAFDDEKNIFFYQRSAYREPTSEELDIGIEKIVPIEGFEGTRNLRVEDLLVLLLGYEGHRALSFLSEYSPYRILPLISLPRDKEMDKSFYDNVIRCNWSLLRRQSVIKDELGQFFTISSLNHIQAFRELSKTLSDFREKKYDISISPIGTKAQTLGLYLYWREHPETQIIYSVPTRRLDITSPVQETLIKKIEEVPVSAEDLSWVYQLPSTDSLR